MQTPLGRWREQEIVDGSWRSEALVVLEWSLGLIEAIPPYDQQTDRDELKNRLQKVESVERFVADARLRPEAEIGKARDFAELWLWRARTTQIQKDPKRFPPPPDTTYEEIIAMTAMKCEEDGLFTPIEQDFPVRGKAYSKISDMEWSELMSIACERLYGLNWVSGYAEDWDDVPTDT